VTSGADLLLAGLSFVAGLLVGGLVLRRRHRPANASPENASAAAKAEFDSIVAGLGVGVTLHGPKGELRFANPAALSILGVSREALLGQKLLPFGQDVLREDGTPLETGDDPVQRALSSGQAVRDVVVGVRRPAHPELSWLSVSAELHTEDGRPTGNVVCTIADVTERRRATDHIRHLAYHDGLTRLPNRELFLDRLAVSVVQAQRHHKGLAVLFVDLDNLKVVNDSLGHSFGDAVIRTAATRLKGALRIADTVARLGGDEFGALLPGTDEGTGLSRVALMVQEALRQPINIEGRDLAVTASIGVALFPGDARDAEALLRCADMAMYRAKELGRNRTEFYAPSIGARVRDQLDVDARLRKALAADTLELYYQPVVNLSNGAVEGVEALLRWFDPEWGQVPTSQVISIAETMGTIQPLGAWSLKRACRDIMTLTAGREPAPWVAVNFSARQFHDGDVVGDVRAAVQESGLPPARLEVEITETVALYGPEATLKTLRGLKDVGVRLAIDDFGTGYSSLASLRHFPVETLKIDQAFVRDSTTNPGAAAIARTIVAIGHQLGLRVVAEGVETEDQLNFLRLVRCDAAQGFLFSPAVPGRDLVRVLSELEDRWSRLSA
jgi:diguanylate cyclase (GGDEF)-like protein